MEATTKSISKVFSGGGDIHYVLPHFQREYSWEKKQWEVMLQDAFAIYEEYDSDGTPPEHFLGSLVVINDGNYDNVVDVYRLVDGQQRLTTLSLVCCVMRNLIEENHPKLARKYHKLIVNSDQDVEEDAYYKVLPTTKYGDRQAYQAIITKQKIPSVESSIPAAYEYIYQEINRKLSDAEIYPNDFYSVIANCFQVVYIELDHRNDSPYKIFESLNAKGKDLSQADLVRNYIAMRVPIKDQEQIFNNYWSKIETILQEKRTVGKSRMGELTAFLRHYLAMHSRILCAESHIYARFRDRCEKNFIEPKEFKAEMAKLSKYARYYDCLIRPSHESNSVISAGLTRLSQLDISTAYPFLLAVYSAYDNQEISEQDFRDILDILENYLIRRYVCNESTNYLNKMFPVLWHDMTKKVNDGEVLKEVLKSLLSNKKYPSDDDIKIAIYKRKFYERTPASKEKTRFILESINRYLSKGTGGYTILENDATIEHILPQNPNDEWKKILGDDYEEVYQKYLNTLGNLTLVTQDWNSKLSNHSFKDKKEKLSQHALKINADYFSRDIPSWNKNSILQRTEFMIDQFLAVWPSFGQAKSSNERTYSKSPKSISIRQDIINIPDKTWLQFRILVVEWGLKKYPNLFDQARKKLATHFCDDPNLEQSTKSWHQLTNGVWLSKNYSAKDHYRFCVRYLSAIGVSESEWSYTENQ